MFDAFALVSRIFLMDSFVNYSSANALPIVPMSTGSSVTNGKDNNWNITSVPDAETPSFKTPGKAVLATTYSPFWVTSISGASWISTRSNHSTRTNYVGSTGFYIYQTYFDLPYYVNYACISLPVTFAADNLLRYIQLNSGTRVYPCGGTGSSCSNVDASVSFNLQGVTFKPTGLISMSL